MSQTTDQFSSTQSVVSNQRRRLLRAASIIVPTTGALSACASTNGNRIAKISPPTGFIPKPTVRSGESWRYALINRYNNIPIGEVTARIATVHPQLLLQLSDGQGQALPDEIYEGAWRVKQESIYNQTLVYQQSVPLLPAEMAVGAREHFAGSYRLAGSETPHPWNVSLRAVGWERIEVPAGSFDTLRVDRHIFFEHHDLFRHRSRRVDTVWYAPAVNRWVMREWTGYYREDSGFPLIGSARGWQEEREDAVRWVLLDHQIAPVAGS